DKLLEQSELVFGEQGRGELVDVADGKGYFQAPVLLQVKDSATATHVHEHEVFGPVASLLPYSGDAADASALIAKGQGGLVSSIYTDDREFAATFLDGGAAFHGRLHFGSKKIAEHSMGPGTVLPQLVHGGPGRAGGGEELGGLRGLSLYLQRTAVQGDEPMIARLAEGGADW
ncbi:MAG: aldehyde dehydrogenase family protein, partial [Acidobacteriota bacterium]